MAGSIVLLLQPVLSFVSSSTAAPPLKELIVAIVRLGEMLASLLLSPS
jgi:hypothetical protein